MRDPENLVTKYEAIKLYIYYISIFLNTISFVPNTFESHVKPFFFVQCVAINSIVRASPLGRRQIRIFVTSSSGPN